MDKSMLTIEQSQVLATEKEVLSKILLRMSEMGMPKEDLDTLQKSIFQLDELFLLVVVGEFNAGKSALINAILGEKVLPEGVTPTTSRVTVVKWGERFTETIVDEGFAIITYPLGMLKQVNIVDSPGTNAIIRQHERLTNEYVPRSDLVLFTTSADRPMTESERQFLERILSWGKKVVFVLNKTDIFENDAALKEAKDYILKHASSILGEIPSLFPVSARMAQKAYQEDEGPEREGLLTTSHLKELEQYIYEILDDSSKLGLKFTNPIGVGQNVISKAQKTNRAQMAELDDDIETVKSLETTISSYKSDLESELSPRLAEVENILNKLEFRGLDFFDRTLRLTNIHHLVRGDRIRSDFEKEVLENIPTQIEEQVHKLIEWLVQKDLHEWRQVMGYLQRRQVKHLDHIVGSGSNTPVDIREMIIAKVGDQVKEIIESYDQTKEASELAINVESAVAQTALFEAGAVGLGTLVATVLASSTVDITGMIAAGTLAVVGFFVIPYKRKQAKDHFREKIVTLRTNLYDALRTAFDTESKNAIARLNESITPYTRYVHAETARVNNIDAQLTDLQKDLLTLEARVEQVLK